MTTFHLPLCTSTQSCVGTREDSLLSLMHATPALLPDHICSDIGVHALRMHILIMTDVLCCLADKNLLSRKTAEEVFKALPNTAVQSCVQCQAQSPCFSHSGSNAGPHTPDHAVTEMADIQQ